MFSFRASFMCALILCASTATATAEIEAVRGKRYNLTRQHGPWMVMVASLRDVDEDRRLEGGFSASEAADQLVYELRSRGIPAYVYGRAEKVEEFGQNYAGTDSRKHFVAQQGYLAVFAGNFPSIDDRNALLVLDYIKNSEARKDKFVPSFLLNESSGSLFAATPGRPSPLSKAFLTVNPLLSPEEVQERTVDKLTRELNADMEYSLLKNKARYTLVIATYTGNSVFKVGEHMDSGAKQDFEKNFGTSLDRSAMDAWALTHALRDARRYGYDRDYEAWVMHDRFKSIVTIGSFDDPNDPRIRTLATEFRSKNKPNPQTGEDMETPEVFTIPRNIPLGSVPERQWYFDGRPRLIEVPQLH